MISLKIILWTAITDGLKLGFSSESRERTLIEMLGIEHEALQDDSLLNDLGPDVKALRRIQVKRKTVSNAFSTAILLWFSDSDQAKLLKKIDVGVDIRDELLANCGKLEKLVGSRYVGPSALPTQALAYSLGDCVSDWFSEEARSQARLKTLCDDWVLQEAVQEVVRSEAYFEKFCQRIIRLAGGPIEGEDALKLLDTKSLKTGEVASFERADFATLAESVCEAEDLLDRLLCYVRIVTEIREIGAKLSRCDLAGILNLTQHIFDADEFRKSIDQISNLKSQT